MHSLLQEPQKKKKIRNFYQGKCGLLVASYAPDKYARFFSIDNCPGMHFGTTKGKTSSSVAIKIPQEPYPPPEEKPFLFSGAGYAATCRRTLFFSVAKNNDCVTTYTS